MGLFLTIVGLAMAILAVPTDNHDIFSWILVGLGVLVMILGLCIKS